MRQICLYLFLLSISGSIYGQDTLNFPPPNPSPTIYAVEATENIFVDGRLNEQAWQFAPVTKNFFMMQPRQGDDIHYETFVKVLYDKKNLYFGVFCKDTAGGKGIRMQDFRRDFTYGENDAFSIQLDPQNLKRFCVSFQATPAGTQADLQVFDDQLIDNYWDALWKVRTSVTDSGYYAEFAIPFKSLRYEKQGADSVSWNIIFSRIARRNFEQTVFPKIPQAFSPYRMAYGAQLRGLQLPPPSINMRLVPFGLYQYTRSTDNSGVTNSQNAFKAGGDIKWAVNPHTVIDATFNTDFAQADIDLAVNNLTRFNILFPDKRQFFLENQGVFAGANLTGLKPFYSRTIGLDNTQFDASPVPIDAGARLTDRTQKRTWAGLYIHQRATNSQGAANFGVFRYIKNYGTQNNIGVMFTGRYDEPELSKNIPNRNNSTITADGFIRPNNKITIQYMVSASRDNSNDSIGNAGNLQFLYNDNKFFFRYQNTWVSNKYKPGMGFVFQNNVIYQQTVEFIQIRPKSKWLNWIRENETGFDVNYYQNASDLKFQQANIYIYPVYILTKNGGLLAYQLYPTWQNINFPFSILGIPIEQKKYYYTLHEFDWNTDASKKISFTSSYTFGKYYNGRQRSLALGLRFAPLPKLTFTSTYTLNNFYKLGINKQNLQVPLYTLELRLALNPRLQFNFFYQFNSYDDQGQFFFRGSWEFAPLSFLYIVFNQTDYRYSPVKNQAVINKISYVKQF